MDIDLLSRMVKELILDTDEVSLPGVGCFVAEMVPSTFSDKGYTINPPYRRLYFRQRPGAEDTALAKLYSTSNNVDYADAERIIGDFLSEMKEVLQQKKIIVFPGLGRLRATRENNFFFVPDEDLDIYPEGFGLEAISLKTHEETTEEVSQALDGVQALIDNSPVEEETPVQTQPVTVEEPAVADAVPTAEEPSNPTEPGPAREDYSVPESLLHQSPAVESPAAQDNELPMEPAVPLYAPEEEAPEETVEERTVPEETVAPAEPAAQEGPVAPQETAEPEIQEAPSEPAIAQKAVSKRSAGKTFLIVCLVITVLALLALGAFLLAAKFAPEWLDTILYTPEQLEILHGHIS